MNTSKLKVAIGAIILSSTISSTAYAGALATAKLKIDNFAIKFKSSGNVVDETDLQSLSFTSTSDVSTSLTSLGAPLTDNGSSNNGAGVDLYVAKGTGGPADNTFPNLTASSGATLPATNFAVADTYEYGAPITGLFDNSTTPPSPVPLFSTDPNAYLAVAAYSSLASPDAGSAQSNNGLQSDFSFTLATAGALTFSFDVDSYVESFLSSGDSIQASSNVSIFFSLEDSTGNQMLDPGSSAFINLLTKTFNFADGKSSNAPGSGVSKTNSIVAPLSFDTINLAANETYTLTARMNATADTELVPEPQVLMLFGLGLLGMVTASRKKV